MTQQQVVNVTRFIDERRLNGLNLRILVLSFLVAASDGFDLQAGALAGPALVQSWHIPPAALGPMFSASLFGMLFGGPLFGAIADRFGRRSAILGSILLYGGFTLLAAGASTLNELTACRFFAGIGLGGLMPTLIAVNAEFSPKRVRATMIVYMYLGVTIGSMLPALVVAHLGQGYQWQTLFVIGGLAPLAVGVVLFFLMPESPKFLVLRKRSRAQIVRLLTMLDPGFAAAPDAEFIADEPSDTTKTRFAVTRLFGDGLAAITLLVWLAYICNLTVNFFLHNWMPILFRADGLSVSQMGVVTAMYDVGGIFGALIAGRLLDKYGIATLVWLSALACPLVASIATPGFSSVGLGAAVFFTGFCIVGIQLSLNATVGVIYPTAIRATGSAWASAIGRFGAIAGPMAGAWLIAMHASTQQLFLAPEVPLIVGLIGIYALMRLCWARFGSHRLNDRATPSGNLAAGPYGQQTPAVAQARE